MSILTSWNWIFICLGLVIGTIIISNIAFSIRCKFIHFSILKKSHDIAGYVIGVFGVLYSIFLGFTVVNSQQNLNNIITTIDEEAYLSESIFQSANILPVKTKTEVQEKVMNYVKSIIQEEWPLMKKKEENPKTLMKLEKMWQAFYQLHPKTEKEKIWYSQSVKYLIKQSSARLKRVYSTWGSIGTLLWLALIIGGIIIISFMFFFGTENMLFHKLLISIFSGYFSFMLFILYALDNPFSGPINIQPKAYQIIYNYDVKTKGTDISPESIKYLGK